LGHEIVPSKFLSTGVEEFLHAAGVNEAIKHVDRTVPQVHAGRKEFLTTFFAIFGTDCSITITQPVRHI
jgi:hypothetical protein